MEAQPMKRPLAYLTAAWSGERDMLRRSHTLIVCGSAVDEDVKNDIAVAGRLGIAATTLEGVLAVKGHGTPGHAGH
mgnify:CR=1 FL=1